MDITMCSDETCPLKASCLRNPASGSKADDQRQTWFTSKPLWSVRKVAGLKGKHPACPYFWQGRDPATPRPWAA